MTLILPWNESLHQTRHATVETVRSLIDRGIVRNQDGQLVVTGDLTDLDTPASLTGLVAARLDCLPVEERDLLLGLSVLGGSFPRAAVTAVTDQSAQRVEELLAVLVRKDVLMVRTDPLSPERGQYAFTQNLLRAVTYDLVPRRQRSSWHSAVAQHLREAFPNDGQDVIEVIASHYHQAATTATGPDTEPLRKEALATLERAGNHAATIGAPATAAAHYLQATTHTTNDTDRLRLLEAAGTMTFQDGSMGRAAELYEQAATGHRDAGRLYDAARITAETGLCLSILGGLAATERLREAINWLPPNVPDAVLARLHTELGYAMFIAGAGRDARSHLETAYSMGVQLDRPDICAYAGQFLSSFFDDLQEGRIVETREVYEDAIRLAASGSFPLPELQLLNNLVYTLYLADESDAYEQGQSAFALARHRGHRFFEGYIGGNLLAIAWYRGDWDYLHELAMELLEKANDEIAFFLKLAQLWVAVDRGDRICAERLSGDLNSQSHSENAQVGPQAVWAERALGLLNDADADGITDRAFEELLEARASQGLFSEPFRMGWPVAMDASLVAGRLEEADRLLGLFDDRPEQAIPPYLQAQRARYQAVVDAAKGSSEGVEDKLRDAIDRFSQLQYPYWQAKAQLDLGRWLLQTGRPQDASGPLEHAKDTFSRLGARPALEQAEALLAPQSHQGTA